MPEPTTGQTIAYQDRLINQLRSLLEQGSYDWDAYQIATVESAARVLLARFDCGDDDGQPVTIHGCVRWVEVRANQSGAPYLEISLATDPDSDDPDTTTVTIPPAVYAQMDAPLKPYAGTQLRISGCTRHEVRVLAADVRQPVWHLDGGEPVYDLSDQPLPACFEDGAR
jgi:hypothetical protein